MGSPQGPLAAKWPLLLFVALLSQSTNRSPSSLAPYALLSRHCKCVSTCTALTTKAQTLRRQRMALSGN